MFSELEAEIAKMEASVRRAFTDVEAEIAALRARVAAIDAGLLASFDRSQALATSVETTVKGRLADVRAAVDRVIT